MSWQARRSLTPSCSQANTTSVSRRHTFESDRAWFRFALEWTDPKTGEADPGPARLERPETIGMFRLLAELIAKSLDADRKLAATESAQVTERADAQLREQFIAVLDMICAHR